MLEVRAFRMQGVALWFWSDDHEPPHFNAKQNGEWEVKVKFMRRRTKMLEIVWTRRRMRGNLTGNSAVLLNNTSWPFCGNGKKSRKVNMATASLTA